MCKHTSQPVLTVVRVFLKNGRSHTLPYRTVPRIGDNPCAGHAEHRFLGWLRRMNGAQPGFTTMIRSVYVRVYGPGCPVCHAQLVKVLGRYHLADRLRYITEPTKTCSCGCQSRTWLSAGSTALRGAGWFGLNGYESGWANELTRSQKSGARTEARRQTDERGMKRTKHRQVDHGVPLAQSHLDKQAAQNPNERNLRLVTQRVHREKEKMWNAWLQSTFYQRCTTPEQRKRKLQEIFTELRKKYPNDTISRAFGQELDLMELSLP